ncbi:MAG TPA: wax ester/triacylglycerol synthase family O-acyltransferase [Nocardioides sp.]|nr:wax ester/triacylglycerol synthase family O-acyltransferase [Nocardioides sp.]
MTERLRPRDVAILAEESPSTPMHNATIEVFDPGQSGFDYARLVRHVQDRISFVPRYRQRVQQVPGRLANPVWVDDDHFDIGYHVRRSALPRPGSLDQLRDLVSRIVSRPLDRSRPLWEMYFIEGLADGQVAILSKSHQVLVDGIETVDLGQVLLDKSPEPKELGADGWRARTRPSPLSLMAEAVRDSLTGPETVVDTVRSTTGAVLRGVASTARSTSRVVDALANRTPSGDSPIIGPLSQQRRVVVVRTDLADYRKVREAHGGTVNDVVLATITGALRAWLMTRGESMRGIRQVRAMVPISVIDDELEATSLGSQIAAHFVDLPVWEASPVVRLHQVSYSFQAHKETGRAVAASRLASISGFAPATFHAIGSRVAAVERRRGYQLSVTNVPGPQEPLYAAGARMLATYPVPPLLEGHPLAIGVTSYDGHVYYGLTADRDMLHDADLLGPCVREALDELVDSASGARAQVPRGRKRRKPAEERP